MVRLTPRPFETWTRSPTRNRSANYAVEDKISHPLFSGLIKSDEGRRFGLCRFEPVSLSLLAS